MPVTLVPSILTILLGLLSTWVISVILLRVHAALASPLRCIPGPWYAAKALTIHALFQKYGPIDHVGPRKVVFCDLDAMRSVYIAQRFDKSPLYRRFAMEGADYSLVLLDNASHTAWRKSIGPHYTAASIASMEPTIRKCTMEVLQRLHSIRSETSVDCLDLLHTLMLDITTFPIFGFKLGAVDTWILNEPNRLCVASTNFAKVALLGSVCPAWVWHLLCSVPDARIASFTNTIPLLKQFATVKLCQAQTQIDGGQEYKNLPLMHRLLKYKSSTVNEQLSSEEVVGETISHLLAGSEPLPASLAYFPWEAALRLEIATAMHDAGVIPDLHILQELTYLTAFIQEGELPPGTIVGTQAWSMHKNPTVFPNPQPFSPERWLDDAELAQSLRNGHLMPFGAGSRACVGKQLAQALLHITLAGLVRNFNIEAATSTTRASMVTKLVGFPAAGQCRLIFNPRRE
ncbi:cytochrome P450 [Mycena rebaudengoi]|nr:cytochrome P450 [Mycena rebaudengoi]